MRQLVSHVSTDYAAFAVTAIFVLIVTLAYLYILERKKNKLSCPGLAPSNPEEGNLGDIKKAGTLHEFLVNLHKKNGPVASFWWGKQLTVSLGAPEVFKDVVTLFNRPEMVFRMFEPLIGKQSIQYANGGRGRKMRQILDRFFSHASMEGYGPVLNEVGDELIKNWKSFKNDERIPVREHMMAVALKAIMLTSFGDYFKSDKQIIAFENAYDICWNDMEVTLTHGLPPPGSEREKNFQAAIERLKVTTRDVITKRRNEKNKKSRILLDILMEEKDVFPTEDDMFCNAITYIVGGFHTTGNLLAWIIYYLCVHPECQEKLFAEMNEIVKDETVTMEHMNQLRYTRQVIDETLRASTLAPFTARYSDFDMLIGGHLIPAKTPLILSLGTVLEDPEIWPEPSRFDPDRFSPENSKDRDNLAFVPFGFAGKRKCPGYRFSYFEATVVLAKVVKNFKFKLAEGVKISKVHHLVTQISGLWITVETR